MTSYLFSLIDIPAQQVDIFFESIDYEFLADLVVEEVLSNSTAHRIADVPVFMDMGDVQELNDEAVLSYSLEDVAADLSNLSFIFSSLVGV